MGGPGGNLIALLPSTAIKSLVSGGTVGKGKRLKAQRKAEREAKRNAGTVADSGQPTPEDLASVETALNHMHMPADLLPSLGLAVHYPIFSPIRTLNQCHIACLCLALEMRALGIEADIVALELAIPWGANGRGIRYGNPSPYLKGDGIVGHVGLLADGLFIDPTANQFSEIRDNNKLGVLWKSLGGEFASVRESGATFQVDLTTGKTVTYTVHPVGSADTAISGFMEAQLDKRAIPTMTENHLVGYGATLAAICPDVETPSAALNERIRAAIGRDVEMQDNVMVLVDSEE